MSALDDVGRMLTLIPWLLERPGASVTETATAFGVEEATIRRDLVEHLDFCGLPGLGGGDLFEVTLVGERIVVRMADELRRPLRPTATEALRLVLQVDAVADVIGDELPALRSATAKVRAALGVPEHVADVVGEDGSTIAAAARRGVADARRVRFTYQGRGDAAPRERDVDPWTVRVVGGTWYLQGHDHGAGAARTFRLDRASAFAVSDEAATVPAPAELPPPRYQPGPHDTTVTLRLGRGARWVADALDVDERRDGDDGEVEVRFTTDAPRHVVRLVLMAGGDAAVVTPAWLADEVVSAARSAAARYGAGD